MGADLGTQVGTSPAGTDREILWDRLRLEVFEPEEPFEVTRQAVRGFATATLELDPVHHDLEVAQRSGYPDLLAPTTYASSLALAFATPARRHPDLRVNFARMVHGEQAIAVSRSVFAGMSVTGKTTITELRVAGRHVRIETTTELESTPGGLPLASVRHLCLVLGGAAEVV